MAELVVASNRGPVQFEIDDDGNLSAGRGAGGMVAALGPALAGQGGTWVAAAISDGDRVAARRVARSGRRRRIDLPQGPVQLRSLVIDPREYQNYYNRVSNRTLWFLQHYLFDVPRHPRFDASFRNAWRNYRDVNRAYAAACDDEADRGAEIYIQDYHLALAPAMLRERRSARCATSPAGAAWWSASTAWNCPRTSCAASTASPPSWSRTRACAAGWCTSPWPTPRAGTCPSTRPTPPR